ncbi:expressed unknown protein [Seminavis robusta]|uniref:DUF6824 domain-containing protein n=1 Tax=Seminavis robusta TaxID=568900 RepID=A0A9N8HJR7_9STRA|nr:expressed unknown protein [Seminavis robusta]|eukprot:Sro707_g190520.1 n/a (281) ;mRNA; f:582-1424
MITNRVEIYTAIDEQPTRHRLQHFPEEQQQERFSMMQPNPLDVLCGKSRTCVNSPGSIRFRSIIDAYADQYAKATSKVEKMNITKQIYDEVSETSRFLKFNEVDQTWEEISTMAARDKVSHALRFATRATRRVKQTTTKRSTSWSSASSSESNGRDSIVQQIMQSSGTTVPSTSLEPSPLSPLKTTGTDKQENNQFEMCSDATVRDTLLLLQEAQALMATTSLLNQLPYNKIQQQAKEENLMEPEPKKEAVNNGDLTTLLSEPIGEWEDAFEASDARLFK